MPFEIYVYDTVECKGLETNKFIIVIFLHFELYAKEYKNAKYINDEKDVEVLNTRSEIFKTNYPWYFASNKYLWLYDDNELILKDESFMTIFNIKGFY